VSRFTGARTDRRTTIKWLAAAAASVPLFNARTFAAQGPVRHGYGMNPDLGKVYLPGQLWPLTLTAAQHVTVAALSDLIIPADSTSPSASEVGVPDFIDEWISAPYPDTEYINFSADRSLILEGIVWLDGQSVERFGQTFERLTEVKRKQICDDICFLPRAKPEFKQPARFFARFRDLTAAGFYTTPQGMKDLQYVGNTPLARFDGPPQEVLRKLDLV
jgi:hypothetical protein